jgi:hypothetical protein
MSENLRWFAPPKLAGHYSGESDILIRGSSGDDDWSVIRYWRVNTGESTPIAAELVVFTDLAFEEAAKRAATMQKYLRNPAVPPPIWPNADGTLPPAVGPLPPGYQLDFSGADKWRIVGSRGLIIQKGFIDEAEALAWLIRYEEEKNWRAG